MTRENRHEYFRLVLVCRVLCAVLLRCRFRAKGIEMNYTAYVIELKTNKRYKVYIEDMNVCAIVNAKSYSTALCSAIEYIFGPDCAYDYDWYAVGGLSSGQPFAQYFISIDE